MKFNGLFQLAKPRRSVSPAPFSSRNNPSRLRLEALEDRTVPSTFVVDTLADSGLGSLRQAVLDANANSGPDVVRFASSARDGTVVLSSGELTITGDLEIDGPGAHRLAISGNDASRVFQIGSGVAVSIDGLTVTHGRAIVRGGGILNAGTLAISNAVLSDNTVVGVPGATPGAVVDAFGGGIFNSGSLTVRHSSFVRNQAIGADGTTSTIGSSALGGAIFSNGTASTPATAAVWYGTFLDNQAVGGAAGIDASRAGVGGAIANATSTLIVGRSLFLDNRAVGGLDNGVTGGFGAGLGGAIGNVARFGSAFLSVSHCTLMNNRAIGGAASAGPTGQDGRGGAIANYIFGGLVSPVTVTAIASIDHSTILGNQAVGGAGPTGGNGQGGGIANLNGGLLTVSDSLIALNRAIGGGGDEGDGGNGQGGGIFNGGLASVGTSNLTLQRSLVTLNSADGGAAGEGGSGGLGQGGGLYLAPEGNVSADTGTLIFANDATTSDDDVSGDLT